MLPWILILGLVGLFALTNVFSGGGSSAKELSYSKFVDDVTAGQVKKVQYDPSTGDITGTFTNLPGATSPYTNALTGAQQFFRLISN